MSAAADRLSECDMDMVRAVDTLGGDVLDSVLAVTEALVSAALAEAGRRVGLARAEGASWAQVASATGFVSQEKAAKRYTGRMCRPASGERAAMLEDVYEPSLSWPADGGLETVKELEVLALSARTWACRTVHLMRLRGDTWKHIADAASIGSWASARARYVGAVERFDRKTLSTGLSTGRDKDTWKHHSPSLTPFAPRALRASA